MQGGLTSHHSIISDGRPASGTPVLRDQSSTPAVFICQSIARDHPLNATIVTFTTVLLPLRPRHARTRIRNNAGTWPSMMPWQPCTSLRCRSGTVTG